MIVIGLPALAAPSALQTFLLIALVAASIAWWLCGLLPR
jgi:hypothetical protein